MTNKLLMMINRWLIVINKNRLFLFSLQLRLSNDSTIAIGKKINNYTQSSLSDKQSYNRTFTSFWWTDMFPKWTCAKDMENNTNSSAAVHKLAEGNPGTKTKKAACVQQIARK